MNDDPRIDPADLRNVRFPGSSRRYDARSVEQFLESVASRIEATNTLVDELRRELFEVRESAPATPPPAAPELSTLDDDDLVRLVGSETASVLSTARRAAEEIRSKAEESAARMIREATAEADRLTDEAKARVVELTADAEQAMERATAAATAEAARIRAEAEEDAETRIAETREKVEADLAALEERRAAADAEVEQILADAREEGRGMVTEAKDVRHRILEDLQRRRDMAREQIERLLAGRERLLDAYELVRENLDDITGQLVDSLPDPRHLPEPELPDGFVGIVGGEAIGDTDDAALDDEVPAEADEEIDDTVAPAADVDDADEAVAGGAAAIEDGHEDEVDAADDAAADESAAAQDGGAEEAEVADELAVGEAAASETEAGDADADADGGDADAGGGDVDALFARLRAEREQSVAKAQQVLESDAGPADEPAEVGAAEVGATAGGAGAADEADESVEVDATEDDVAEVEAGPDDDAADAGADEGDDDEGEPVADEAPGADEDEDEGEPVADEAPGADGDEGEADGRAGDVDRVPAEFLAAPEALERRAEALEPLDGRLNRALKRQLADEQNELLDLLRRSGSTDAAELLPPADEQVATYARVASKHLTAAAAAGVAATGGSGTDVDVDALAQALGAALVEPFRRRVERSASEVDGDADELDERLRALYREWKVQHIAPATDDALLSAYALGTLTAARPDGGVRWCIDPRQGPCPDAQDNALAGVVAAGEAFPTGDECPQAHPGCRCLLVAE